MVTEFGTAVYRFAEETSARWQMWRKQC